MTIETVTAVYANGVSTLEIPAGINPDDLFILMNGQVWTGSNLTIVGSTVTVAGVDLSGEVVQLADALGSSNVVNNSSFENSALANINQKMDVLLATSGVPSTAITPSIKASGGASGVASSAAIQELLSSRRQRLGMSAHTGRLLTGIEHLEQSIADILRTALKSRVMRRDYGSDLYLHKDKNLTPARAVMIYASAATAIEKDEPRVVVNRVWLDQDEAADLEDGVVMIVISWRIASAYQVDFLSDLSSVAANDGYFTQRVVVGL